MVTSHGDVIECRCKYRGVQLKKGFELQYGQEAGNKSTMWLIKPTGPFPLAIRASLIKVIMEATTGADADVPNTRPRTPSMPIQQLTFPLNIKD